jgi:eukaryotic-like serine/threonine-protein kinase
MSEAARRYAIHGELARGGMASVHVGRTLGAIGFSRVVAVKRMFPQYACNPRFVAMFVDEARLAARIRHPNVVPTIDVVKEEDELLLVLEYVPGESLSAINRLVRQRGERIPLPIVVAIITGTLDGLHAAHEARTENGEALEIVHRDVSPQNILVGVDGVTRIIDFGIAQARFRFQVTLEGEIKGKLQYMAPEQLRLEGATRRSDVYSTGVVLWEAVTGERLIRGDSNEAIMLAALQTAIPRASTRVDVPPALDDLIERATARDPADRFATAREMQIALEHAAPTASHRAVREWLAPLAADSLARRAALVEAAERQPSEADLDPPPETTTTTTTGGRAVFTLTATIREPAEYALRAQPPSEGAPGGATKPAPPPVEPQGAQRRQPAWGRLAIGAVAAIAIVGTVSKLTRRAAESAPSSNVADLAAAHASSSDATEPRPVAPVAPPPSPTPSDATAQPAPPPTTAEPAPSETPRAPPPPIAPAPPREPAPRPRAEAPPPAPGPSVKRAQRSCNPPYYVDASGIRRVKRECLP